MNALKAALLPLALLPMLLGGCAQNISPNLYKGDQYDERYRLFFSKAVPINVKAGDSIEDIAAAFMPTDAVRQALTQISEEGFALSSIEPVKWGDGAAIFTFRKEIGDFDRKEQRSPIHYTGVFVRDENGQPVYYTFLQRRTGYVVSVSGGSGKMKSFPTEWVARELTWKDDAGFHTAQLSPDANTLYVISETAEDLDAPSERVVVTAERVVDHQKPDSPAERDARRYLAPLRQQSQRIYDPFPW